MEIYKISKENRMRLKSFCKKNPNVNFVCCKQFLILTKIHLFLDDNESKVDVTVEEMDKFEKIGMAEIIHLTG